MARTPRLIPALLVFTAPATLALWTSAKAVHATGDGTIVMTVYNNQTGWNQHNESPPIPPTTPIAGRELVSTVARNFDQEPVFGLWDDFQIEFTGHIHTDSDTVVHFIVQADDGTTMSVDSTQISNDWYDKGGGGSVSAPVEFVAGVSRSFTVWFYENGGGAWLELWWDLDGQWGPVPASAYTLEPVPVPTTTSTTTTSTTLPVSSVPPLPTTTQPSETTTTTTTTAPSTTTYQVTTTINQTTTTQAAPNTTKPTGIPSTTVTVPPTAPSTTAPTLQQTMDPEQAAALATSAQVVQNLTADQAAVLFAAIDIGSVSDEQAAAVVAAVQDAPVEVREQFEAEIDVFSGKTDMYIPLGSTVNVATRRVLVVSVAFTIAAPLPSRRSRI